MVNPMYSDEPEICSLHDCEMDGEYCYECEVLVRELVEDSFAEALGKPVQTKQRQERSG